MKKEIKCDWCTSVLITPREGQRFCRNENKCRNAWHKHNNKATSGVRGKIRSIRTVKGGETSVTVRLPAAEHGRAVNLKQGQEIGLIE